MDVIVLLRGGVGSRSACSLSTVSISVGVKLGLTLEMYKILTIVLLKKKKKVFQSYILLFSELLFQAFIKRHYYLVFSQQF